MATSNAVEKSAPKVTNFEHVRFTNLPESFAANSDVECSYVIGSQLEVTSRDWVGIYKVGWRASSDYVYYDWSPLSADYTPGKELTNCITFPGSKLPKDDGEFYQFCYVSGSGQVRGASAPFQFKLPMPDDFIEIEDENGELLVVRSKSSVLEEQLKKANAVRMELRLKLEIVENEKSLMSFTIRELEKKLAEQKGECELLQSQLRDHVDRSADLQQETKDLQVQVRSLQEKMEVLNQEKVTMEKRLDDSDVYIVSLQEKIKNLVTEKDALSGAKKVLEEEKDQFQRRAESSEKQHQLIMTECEQIGARLNESEANRRSLRLEINELRHAVEQKNDKHLAAKEYLSEKWRNTEDKLEAAEICKKMLNEEVLALKQAYEKMSCDLEVAKAEADSAKCRLRQLEAKSSREIAGKHQELHDLELALQQKDVELKTLVTTMTELRRQADERSVTTDDDAMYVLQTSLTTLKDRYAKLTRENTELKKNYEHAVQTIRHLEEQDGEQKEEISNLKQRLLIGQETYKETYLDKQRLQSELDRLIRGEGQRQSSEVQTIATGQRLPQTTNSNDGASVDPNIPELLQHMSEIRREMDKRTEKASKYKHLYVDQKRKYEAVNAQLQQLLQGNSQKSLPVVDSPKPVEQQVSREGSVDRETLNSFDPLAQSATSPTMLAEPLKPLPPPIQPEILPSAKVASVKATLGAVGGGHGIVVVMKPDGHRHVIDISTDFEPSSAADEQFVDAPGEPLPQSDDNNSCHGDYSDTFAGYVCPVCNSMFDDATTIEVFQQHVNDHFD